MIRLVLLIGLIYGIFWIDSPPGRAWREDVSTTLQEKGVRGMMEPVWCGERGCDPKPSAGEVTKPPKSPGK